MKIGVQTHVVTGGRGLSYQASFFSLFRNRRRVDFAFDRFQAENGGMRRDRKGSKSVEFG